MAKATVGLLAVLVVAGLITPQRYERHGTHVIHPKPLILWEGIYAVLTSELEDLVDKIFYVDAPYAVRIMRRIYRFIEERGGSITDEQAVSSPTHMLSSILLAEKDFVITQRPKADYIVNFDSSIVDNDFQALEQATANLTKAESLGVIHDSKQIGEGSIELHERGLAIQYQSRKIYAIQLDETTMKIAKANFDYIQSH